MEPYICTTCGAQHAASESFPQKCAICEDERQYINWEGQQWTTLEQMRNTGYRNEIRTIEPNLVGIGTRPSFAIGQRSLLVRTQHGNILWDCISFIDEETISEIANLGGIQAISASHPHFYASMVEWSRAFGHAPIYLPQADRQWIMRTDPAIAFWDNSLKVFPGVTLVQCGGHFAGSSVLHWQGGADGKGAILVGDTASVTQDRAHVSFMRSYPNLIPLCASAIEKITQRLGPYEFDRVYGGWWGKNIMAGGKRSVIDSARRYIKWIQRA